MFEKENQEYERLLKIYHELTEHTLSYRYPDAKPGAYTDTDMCAGDTICFSFSFLSSKYIYFTSSLTAYYLKIKHMECRLCIVRRNPLNQSFINKDFIHYDII